MHGVSTIDVFSLMFADIQQLKYEKGLALEDILREVHLTVMRSKISFAY